MKRLTKKMLSLLLVISMLAVHFITPINVFADEQVTITIDVNGGNELLESTITGPKGNSLYEIAMAQEEGYYYVNLRNLYNQIDFEFWLVVVFGDAQVGNYLTDEDINPMDPINEDLGVKLLWGNAQLYSDDIEIEAEPPMVGEDYSLHDEQAENLIAITVQDPTPLIGGDGLDFDVFDVPFENRMFMVRTCNDPINENACLVPFEGTIQQGQTYYLGFYIKINEKEDNEIEYGTQYKKN